MASWQHRLRCTLFGPPHLYIAGARLWAGALQQGLLGHSQVLQAMPSGGHGTQGTTAGASLMR